MKRKSSWTVPDGEKIIDTMENAKENAKAPGKGLLTSIKQYIQEYCNSSSIHGIRYMGEKGRSGTER